MPDPTHTLTIESPGKVKVTNVAKKQKQTSVDKDWKNLSTSEKLDLLAQAVGLIDDQGQIVLK